MKLLSLSLAATVMVLSLSAFADKPAMKPGQWEYKIKMDMPGMPFQMPPVTYKHCLTQKDIDEGKQYENKQQDRDCQVKNLKQSAGTASYDIACKDGTNGHYEFTQTDAALTGQGVMNTGDQQFKTDFTAKRLGDCN